MSAGRDDLSAAKGIVARKAARGVGGSDGGAAVHANAGAGAPVEADFVGGAAVGASPPSHSAPRLRSGSAIRRLLLAVAWLVMWQLASLVVGMPLILPGPVAVVARLVELGTTPASWHVLASTLSRVAMGFSLAFVLALVLAAASARWPVVAEALRPPLAVLRATPIVCVIVVLLLWVGSRGVSAIAAFVVVFPPTYFSACEGLSGLDERMNELLSSFRVRQVVRVFAHVWPSVVPYVAAASETTCSMALKAGVAAELIGSPLGTVGERIYQAKLLLETTDVLAWTLVVVLVAAAFSRAFVVALRASADVALRAAVALAARRDASAVPEPSEIRLEGVTVAYGEHVVVRDVTREFPVGSRTVMTDPSGAGKTTLLLVVAGLERTASGRVVAPATSVVFQDARLFERLSATDNVVLASGVSSDEAASALAEVLPDADPTALAATLSGGQRRRVELVRALLAPSSAVLLDEPFAALDDDARASCCSFLLGHLAGRTLLVASHDPADARLLDASVTCLIRTRE